MQLHIRTVQATTVLIIFRKPFLIREIAGTRVSAGRVTYKMQSLM